MYIYAFSDELLDQIYSPINLQVTIETWEQASTKI